MSTLDELPDDQRAALALLLSQRKSYAELAGMLGIPEHAVHDRAHAALAVLAPARARAVPAERRAEIGDYLLGQQRGVAERLRTRTYLAGEEAARAWAEALSRELTPLTGAAPADIPAPRPPVPVPAATMPAAPVPAAPVPAATAGAAAHSDPAPVTPLPGPARPGGEAPRSSRLGGALLLAALVVAVAVAVILIVSSGSGSKPASSPGAARAGTAAASASGPTKGAPLPLRSPSPGSHSVGVVEVLSEGAKRAFYIDAEHLPATHNFFYAIWLYNSATSAEALSKSPAVGSDHKLAGGALLPSNAGAFHEIILTRETSPHPVHPGAIVLRGAFKLG